MEQSAWLGFFDLPRRVAECLDRDEGTRRGDTQQLQAPAQALAPEVARDDDQIDIAPGMRHPCAHDPNRVMRSGRMRSRRSSRQNAPISPRGRDVFEAISALAGPRQVRDRRATRVLGDKAAQVFRVTSRHARVVAYTSLPPPSSRVQASDHGGLVATDDHDPGRDPGLPGGDSVPIVRGTVRTGRERGHYRRSPGARPRLER